jgi:hypothetical protein
MMKGDIMMRIRTSCLLLLTIAVLLGCAGLKAQVSHTRQGNEITYEDQKSGRHVKVVISPAFEYKDLVARETQGVAIKGYLFVKNEDQILVTRVHRDDFQTLTGISIETEAADFVQFDPFTFFDKPACEFVRTQIHTVSEFLIIAAYFKRLDSSTTPCDDWLSVDDVAAAEPELLDAFNTEADGGIQMSSEK